MESEEFILEFKARHGVLFILMKQEIHNPLENDFFCKYTFFLIIVLLYLRIYLIVI